MKNCNRLEIIEEVPTSQLDNDNQEVGFIYKLYLNNEIALVCELNRIRNNHQNYITFKVTEQSQYIYNINTDFVMSNPFYPSDSYPSITPLKNILKQKAKLIHNVQKKPGYGLTLRGKDKSADRNKASLIFTNDTHGLVKREFYITWFDKILKEFCNKTILTYMRNTNYHLPKEIDAISQLI